MIYEDRTGAFKSKIRHRDHITWYLVVFFAARAHMQSITAAEREVVMTDDRPQLPIKQLAYSSTSRTCDARVVSNKKNRNNLG